MRELLLNGLDWDYYLISDKEGILTTKFLGESYALIFDYNVDSSLNKDDVIDLVVNGTKEQIIKSIFFELSKSLKDEESVIFLGPEGDLRTVTLKMVKS